VVLSLPVAEGTGISNGVRPGVRGGDSG
jgi:hypothetical protein